jgi:hypothetical protein
MLIVVSICIIGLIFACSTDEPTTREGDTGAFVKTLSNQGVTITAQYLNNKMLYDRFGTRNNPFIEYLEEPLVVISMSMSSEETVRFRLGRVEVYYLTEWFRPVGRVELKGYWERVLRNQGVAQTGSQKMYKNWSLKTVSQVINDNVLQDTVDITPGSDQSGLMLFQGRANRYGTAKIIIPIYNMKGKEIHEFIFVINT